MRIRIDHETTYAYDRPARSIIQALRLTPRSTEAQQIRDWRIETDVNARLRAGEDAFSNIVHTLYTEQPGHGLTITVSGEAVTVDTGGVLRAPPEKLSPLVFLRDTPLTAPDAAIREFTQDAAGDGDRLDQLHRLMGALHARIAFEIGATDASHTAAEAFALGRGVCQDHAHLFSACARRLGTPARYVSGHLLRADGQEQQEASHAWAEAWVEGLGWVGFDAANGVCPTDAYVRVAAGPDYLAAAPVRGSTLGGGAERLTVRLRVREVQQASQQ